MIMMSNLFVEGRPRSRRQNVSEFRVGVLRVTLKHICTLILSNTSTSYSTYVFDLIFSNTEKDDESFIIKGQ